jgi:hypothetical protein
MTLFLARRLDTSDSDPAALVLGQPGTGRSALVQPTTTAAAAVSPLRAVRRLRTWLVAVAALGFTLALSGTAGAVPTVGNTQPPGTAGLVTILGWGGWVVGFLGVAGILIVAAMMFFKHRRGESGESYAALGTVLGGLVLGTAAAAIAGALYA